jgi:arylsulfatase A-like enzyme
MAGGSASTKKGRLAACEPLDLFAMTGQTKAMNAIVVTFDRLPESFLGCCGSAWVETPNFDRLAAQSALFHQHFAEDLSRDATRHAWWSGRYECRAGAAKSAAPLLPALLADKGVTTRILLEGPALNGGAFGGFPELTETVSGTDGLNVAREETPFFRLVGRALRDLRLLRTSRSEPWLLWIKSRGVPSPWLPPRDLATRFLDFADEGPGPEDETGLHEEASADEEAEIEEGERDEPEEEPDTVDDELEELAELAAAVEGDDAENAADDGLVELTDAELDQLLESSSVFPDDPAERRAMTGVARALGRKVLGGYIALLDAGLGQLLDQIDRSAGSSPTLLLVTGAQGLVLREPGVLSNEWEPLAEESVHAPLLVSATGTVGGARHQMLTQPVDLFPTLAEWFGLDVAGIGLEGQSLLPVLQGRSAEDRGFAFSAAGAGLAGVRSRDFYLVRRREASGEGEHRLFAKPEDTWEVNDVAGQSPGIVDELAAELEKFLGSSQR